MIRFNIEGEYLELPANFSLQFQKRNILFAFDNIECERSTSFDIPATPTNDRIFALARSVQTRGEGMRRRYDAQMQGSMIVKNGYLYVDSFSGGNYKAIFVTGELLGLQKIKNAGKLKEFAFFDETTIVTDNPNDMVAPSLATNDIWANVAYRKGVEITYYVPSISLDLLYTRLLAQLGVTGASLPTGATGVRILPPKASGVNELMTFTQRIEDASQPEPPYPTNSFNSAVADSRYFETENTDYGVAAIQQGSTAANLYYNLVCFKTKVALRFTFPENWNPKLYLHDYVNGGYLGGRSFTKSVNQQGVTPIGEPLAGRTIDLPAETCFLIVNSDEFKYTRTEALGRYYYDYGMFFGSEFEKDFQITVKSADDIVPVGDIISLQDNLPDITFTDLLKTIAALSGTSLYYTDANGISFDGLDFETWSVLDISQKILKTENVMRKFGDYAQRNIVKFESDDYVIDSGQTITRAYTVGNDNIAAEKELQKIPFSEGVASYGELTIRKEPTKPTLGTATGANLRLLRVSLPENGGVQTLCDASTSMSVQMMMTQLEFERLTPKTLLYFNGVLYVWTEAQFQKNVATLKLSKI